MLTASLQPTRLGPLTVIFMIDLTRRFANQNATFFSHTFTQGDKDMLRNFSKLVDDEQGFVISAELVLVMTIAVLAMVVGLTAVRDSITQELNDISHAFGAVNQSYNVNGLKKELCYGGAHAYVAGFGFNDKSDDCDCKPIAYIEVRGKIDSSNGMPHEGNGW